MAATDSPPQASSSAVKDPETWTTGDEPMTDAQRVYLQALAEGAGEDPNAFEGLTKAQASQAIEEHRVHRGPGQAPLGGADVALDPRDWASGEDPMTGPQRSYLHTLAREAGVDPRTLENLTKAQASLRIDELQRRTGRGRSDADPSSRR